MPTSFEVLPAGTIGEALLLLARYGKGAKLIAGGTDVLPKLKNGWLDSNYFIDILGIPNLDEIDIGPDESLQIGALTTIASLENSSLLRHRYPILAEAAGQLGSPQVRNMATMGGNLCNASPAADMAPPLLVLDARMVSTNGEMKMTASEDFFSEPSKTALSHEEMLIRIDVPRFPSHSGAAYVKFGLRRAMEIALVGVAAFVQLDPGMNKVENVRICLGAVAPRPIRARMAEEILKGKEFQPSLIEKVAASAAHEARPISDVRASASFRRDMVRILTVRSLELARERARKDSR